MLRQEYCWDTSRLASSHISFGDLSSCSYSQLALTVLTRVLIVAGATSRPLLSAREKLLLQPFAIIPRLPSLVWRAIADALLIVLLQLLF